VRGDGGEVEVGLVVERRRRREKSGEEEGVLAGEGLYLA